MGWRQGPRENTDLERLGDLSGRVVRLALFHRLRHIEEQLKDRGVETELSKEFAAGVELKRAPKEYSKRTYVRVHEPEENTF